MTDSLPAVAAEIEPLEDRVVVEPIEGETMTAGGLHIPEVARDKSQQGRVTACGPGRYEHGHLVPTRVKVGDLVLYGKFAGTEVALGDTTLLIIRESDIMGIVK